MKETRKVLNRQKISTDGRKYPTNQPVSFAKRLRLKQLWKLLKTIVWCKHQMNGPKGKSKSKSYD